MNIARLNQDGASVKVLAVRTNDEREIAEQVIKLIEHTIGL